jgi:fatty acid desaturase
MSDIAAERLQTSSHLFAHSRWDAIPVMAGILHCAYFFGMFLLFPRVPLWVMLPLGFIYSASISWNINGVSHNFIHNPNFRSPLLNRLFSIIISGPRCTGLVCERFAIRSSISNALRVSA